MDEIELKLQLDDDTTGLIVDSGLLQGAPKVKKLNSVYFDTPDHALAAADISLRIRRTEDRLLQTVKAAGASAAGLYARAEWEKAVTSDVPVIDATTPVHTVLGDRSSELTRLFQVDVTRSIWMVTEGEAVIEVALDRGDVLAGERRSPVSELELELKSGPADALFVLARRLGEIAPLRLGVLTKSERGYLLIQATRPAVKAEPVPLAPDMSAAEAFQRIAQSCLRQFRLNEDLIFPAREAEPLHQARVALRRLRSALSIFKPVIGKDSAPELRTGLRDLAGALGPARDLDVLIQRANPGPLHDRLMAEREAAYDSAEQALKSDASRALMLDLVEWIASGDWLYDPATEKARAQPARDFAADALNRFRSKVKKEGRDLKHIPDEARHDLRKDAKKLRYAADFFAPLFSAKSEKPSRKKFAAALEDVQDQLGALNDLATAPMVLERLGVADDPDAGSLLVAGRRKRLLADAADAHEALVAADRYWRRG